MASTHISEAEAARDLPTLLARIRNGEEVVIESNASPVAVLLVATKQRRRLISEAIALEEDHERQSGQSPVMDADFAEDVAEIIRNRKPWNPSAWD